MRILYLKIDDPFIQTHKSILNQYINKDCFPGSNDSEQHDSFHFFSLNQALLGLMPHKEGLFHYRRKSYHVVTFFVTSFEKNNDCVLWDVCTPIPFRRQHFFSACMNYFLKHKARLYSSVSLFVDYQKPNCLSLLSMYAKFGFKIIHWDKYYKMQWFPSCSSIQYLKPLYVNTFRFTQAFSIFKHVLTQYPDFHFSVDSHWTLMIQHAPSVWMTDMKQLKTYKKQVYPIKDKLFIFPYYHRYFEGMKDFLQCPKVFQYYWNKIQELCLFKSFSKIYSGIVNPIDPMPRLFICIE